MKRLLMITAAVLAFAGAVDASAQDLSGQDGSTQEQTYRMNGKPVQVWTDDKGEVEMRLIPGWQLDPKCPRERWGEDCNGGQGFLFFIGRAQQGNGIHGEARTGRCPEMFPAYAERGKGGRLTIYRLLNADDGIARNSKCNVTLMPAKDPRK